MDPIFIDHLSREEGARHREISFLRDAPPVNFFNHKDDYIIGMLQSHLAEFNVSLVSLETKQLLGNIEFVDELNSLKKIYSILESAFKLIIEEAYLKGEPIQKTVPEFMETIRQFKNNKI